MGPDAEQQRSRTDPCLVSGPIRHVCHSVTGGPLQIRRPPVIALHKTGPYIGADILWSLLNMTESPDEIVPRYNHI